MDYKESMDVKTYLDKMQASELKGDPYPLKPQKDKIYIYYKLK
jgi:hypothetical protein